MTQSRLPLLAFAACAIIWGSTFLVISIGNDSLPPIWSLSLRLVVAGLILAGIMAVRRIPWPRGAALKAAILFGLLEYGLSMPLLYIAESTIPSGLAALLYATCPIGSMFFGALFKTETLNSAKVLAGLAAIAGLAIIFSGEMKAGSALGVLAGLAAAITAVLGNIALIKGPEQSAFGSTAVASFVGLGVCLPLSLLRGEAWALPATPQAAFPILYLALFGSVCAFSLAVWLLGRWQASSVSFLGVICPVIALGLGAAIRHEQITPLTMVGGAIVLASVLVALQVERNRSQAS